MKITTTLPQQESVDFNKTCYAFLVIGASKYRIRQVGLSEQEVRQSAIDQLEFAKESYKEDMCNLLQKVNMKEPTPDYFHKGISFQIVECDMKFYIHFKNKKKKQSVNFIFDRVIPPIKIKYAR